MTESGFLAVSPNRQNSAVAEIAKSKAVQEVQAALVIAKNFPRDINLAYQRVMDACKRPFLAQKAMYSYPRAGTTITGPSIRLAEVLAQNYGNLDFGVRELERKEGLSIVESYCWDMETNTRQTKTFEISHELKLKNGSIKKLDDPRDIYEIVANNGARRLRACILGIIPIDIVDAAVQQVKLTLTKGDGKPLVDRARALAGALKEHFGVTLEMIETKFETKLDLVTGDQFVELIGIFNALKDKQANKSDFFLLDSPVKQASASAETVEVAKAFTAFAKRLIKLHEQGVKDEEIEKLLGKSIDSVSGSDSKTIYAALEVLADVPTKEAATNTAKKEGT